MKNLTPMDYYGDEHLSNEEAAIRRYETNVAMRKIRENNNGEVLGHYVVDKETGDLIFVPNP
jgi:hypothetical protein